LRKWWRCITRHTPVWDALLLCSAGCVLVTRGWTVVVKMASSNRRSASISSWICAWRLHILTFWRRNFF
jgi:hypothetical protein